MFTVVKLKNKLDVNSIDTADGLALTCYVRGVAVNHYRFRGTYPYMFSLRRQDPKYDLTFYAYAKSEIAEELNEILNKRRPLLCVTLRNVVKNGMKFYEILNFMEIPDA